MTDLAKLVVKLEAQTAQYQRELDKANKKLGGFEKKTRKSMAGIKTAMSGLAVGAFVAKIVQATAKQEKALAQLEAGLKSTGHAAGLTREQLAGFAAELQKATTFGDEEIINAQANLLTFTKVAGDQFNRTTRAALDLSIRVGQDLKSSVIQLGKALNDPVANLGALSRSGIQFSEDQKQVIKSLAETGRLADAQTLILDELEKQYGGSARAARDTFGGALQGLQNAFGDLFEADGGLEDSKEAVEQFTKLLQDPNTIKSANALTSSLFNGFSRVVETINNTRSAINTFLGRAESLGEVQFEIEKIEQLLNGSWVDKVGRVRFFGPDGLITYYGEEELLARLEHLRKKRAEILAPAPAGAFPPPSGTAPSGIFVPPPPGNTGDSPAVERALKERRRLEEIQRQQLQSVLDFLKTEEQLLADRYENQRQIVLDSALVFEEKQRVISELQSRYLQEIVPQAGERAKEFYAEMERARNEHSQETPFDNLFGPGALANLLSDFENIEDNFKRMLANMAQQLIASQVASMFASGATGGGAGWAASIASIFGGARADGGPVEAGKLYLTSERGPELFVPRTSGHIVPNHELGAATYNTTIILPGVTDADSFRRSKGQIERELVRSMHRGRRNT